MNSANYLVLVKFAAVLSRDNLATVAPAVRAAVSQSLSSTEAIFTSIAAVAFVGKSTAQADSLFRLIGPGLHPGDELSVIELGREIATSHRGLHNWAERLR